MRFRFIRRFTTRKHSILGLGWKPQRRQEKASTNSNFVKHETQGSTNWLTWVRGFKSRLTRTININKIARF